MPFHYLEEIGTADIAFETVVAKLKGQAPQLQKVSAQTEMSRLVPKVVLNNR